MTLTGISNVVCEQYADFKELRRLYMSAVRPANRETIRDCLQHSEDLLLDFVNDLMVERRCTRTARAVQWEPFKGVRILDNKNEYIDLQSLLARGVKLPK